MSKEFNKNLKVIYTSGDDIYRARVLTVATKERVDELFEFFKSHYPECSIKDVTEFVDENDHMEDQARQIFEAFGDYYEVYQNGDHICVDIENGDWKHDHGHCDHIMKTVFGLECIKEDLWEDSEDDSYSATHTFA